MEVPIEIVKEVECVRIGLFCPECDGRLYATVESVARAATEPAICDSCDYSGFKHGGFDIPAVSKFLRELRKGRT